MKIDGDKILNFYMLQATKLITASLLNIFTVKRTSFEAIPKSPNLIANFYDSILLQKAIGRRRKGAYYET